MTYIGNELQWKKLIEVDWLGQYIKAWVAFNAWYRNNFKPPPEKRFSDSDIIEKIKNDEGGICSKIENLLSGTDSTQKLFQSDVAALHKALSQIPVKSKGKRIWLKEIWDYHYVNPIEYTRHTIKYEIQIDSNQKKRTIKVTRTKAAKAAKEIFNKDITAAEEEKFQSEDWFENLSDSGWFENLSQSQRSQLRVHLKESSPFHNLHDFSPDPNQFTGDKKLIARAHIEILYQLRNALFHGEVTPNKVQTVYQPAYLVLKQIIP